MLRADDYVKSMLVQFAWRQGKEYGGHKASCMILSVLANRQRNGWGTWLEVLQNVDRYAAAPLIYEGQPELWDPNFTRLLQEVDLIYSGAENYAVGYRNRTEKESALYWADTRRMESEFFKKKIYGNPEHARIGEMNTLALFR